MYSTTSVRPTTFSQRRMTNPLRTRRRLAKCVLQVDVRQYRQVPNQYLMHAIISISISHKEVANVLVVLLICRDPLVRIPAEYKKQKNFLKSRLGSIGASNFEIYGPSLFILKRSEWISKLSKTFQCLHSIRVYLKQFTFLSLSLFSICLSVLPFHFILLFPSLIFHKAFKVIFSHSHFY